NHPSLRSRHLHSIILSTFNPATCNLQPTFNFQLSTCNVQRATCNQPHPAHHPFRYGLARYRLAPFSLVIRSSLPSQAIGCPDRYETFPNRHVLVDRCPISISLIGRCRDLTQSRKFLTCARCSLFELFSLAASVRSIGFLSGPVFFSGIISKNSRLTYKVPSVPWNIMP